MVIAKEELRKMRDHAGQVAQKENAHHGPLPNELKVVERFFLVLSKNNTKMNIDMNFLQMTVTW